MGHFFKIALSTVSLLWKSRARSKDNEEQKTLVAVPAPGRWHKGDHCPAKLCPNPKAPAGPLAGTQSGQSPARTPALPWHHGHGHGMSKPKARAQQIDQEILSFPKPPPANCLLGICCRDWGGCSHLPLLIIANHRVVNKLSCIPVACVDQLLFI